MCTVAEKPLDAQKPIRQDAAGVFPSADPIHAATPLPFRRIFFPYGFPADVKSNKAEVIRTAAISWGASRERFRENPIELRILVSDSQTRCLPPAPVFRAQANLLTLIADAENFGCCDLATGFGFACLTRAVVRDKDFMRYHFLESMAYALLDTSHVVSLHAACVGRDGRGVLLAGESGAGKSSLAYACACRGWTYISDDASSIVLRKKGRTVVGNPRTFRFRPSARSLFPELQGAVYTRNGKPTIEVETERLPCVKVAYECSVGHIVFLSRNSDGPAAAQLTRISSRDYLRRLFQNPWPKELAIHQERIAAIERLMEAPACELSYREFDPAIDLLDELVAGDGSGFGDAR